MSTNGNRRAGKGAAAHSVGKSSRPTEPTRARRTTQPPAPPTDRQRLVATARELERLAGVVFDTDQVMFLYLTGCWLGAHYTDHSEGGLVEYRNCGPRL